ncbi:MULTISPECIES: DUF3967 domain-containing protein [unclassified Bacillus (in: firmicutes)]|uniref:DUF3967 domain-containing protein n=1 Tax=unclassified Bacillus (in: firmicutes) TaxID=185979 RepID=UPI000BF892B2|nr:MULTISPECIES: DUF3967 domain-containing protein [unclassified Bacillus (in: firmicutes)]PEU10656.1 DNA-binding protein [Bacillus sp. AFS014408]PFW59205.1 DNA-binding protein [Bacillus sp. AFS075034]
MTIEEDQTGESRHGSQDSTYKKTYSLADIARILKKPRTTIQAWRDQFKPYLPTVPGTKGRTLRYQRESLELFKLIANLKDAQEPPDVIENVLKGTVNYIVIDEETTQDDIMNKPILEMMHENMTDVAVYLQNQEALNMQLIQHMKELEETNKALLTKIEEQQKVFDSKINSRDQQFLELIREVQETKKLIASSKQEKSWFTKLFKK